MRHFNIKDFKIVYDGTFLEVPKINQLTKEQAKELLDVVLFWVENDSLPEEVDWELEEAKNKYKLGSYFQTRHSDDILMVKEVYRGLDDGTIIIVSKCGSCNLSDCTPFPLPVWRCCASDKPKKSGEYAMRSKGSKKIFSVKYSIATAFWDRTSVIDCPYSDFEWLDEGER